MELGLTLLTSIKNKLNKLLFFHDPNSEAQAEAEAKADPDENYYYSEWHNLPDDILISIIGVLKVEEFARMTYTCKSWLKSLSKPRSLCLAPQHPWLLMPQSHAPYNQNKSLNLTFMDIFEGKIRTMDLPHPVRGGWCCGSSKGWLLVANGPKFDPDIFLVNPISGQTLPLPPLSRIPGYHAFARALVSSDGGHSYVYRFINKIEVSRTPQTDDDDDDDDDGVVVVAACLLFENTALAFCEIGSDHTSDWTLFGEPIDYETVMEDEVWEDDELVEYMDMVFSPDGTTLYVYTDDPKLTDDEDPNLTQVVPATYTTRVLSLFDETKANHHQLTLKFIPFVSEHGVDGSGFLEIDPIGTDINILRNAEIGGFFVGTPTGKFLMVHKVTDIMLDKLSPELEDLLQSDGEEAHEGDGDEAHDDDVVVDGDEAHDDDDDDDDDDGPCLLYPKTRLFEIYSINLDDTGHVSYNRLSRLDDDEAIFVGRRGSLLVSRSDFDDGNNIQGNCIYFLEDYHYHNDDNLNVFPYVSRELGVFDINTGKVNRCLPSVSYPLLSNMLWFTPSPC